MPTITWVSKDEVEEEHSPVEHEDLEGQDVAEREWQLLIGLRAKVAKQALHRTGPSRPRLADKTKRLVLCSTITEEEDGA